jgi:hypothetical protein
VSGNIRLIGTIEFEFNTKKKRLCAWEDITSGEESEIKKQCITQEETLEKNDLLVQFDGKVGSSYPNR